MANLDFSAMIARLKTANQTVIGAARLAADRAMAQVLGQAQQLAPVGGPPFSPRDPAPGTLKGADIQEPATWDGRAIVSQIGFGGPASAYALVQHERLDFRHSQGQAKFLSIPLQESAGKISPLVAAAIKTELGG